MTTHTETSDRQMLDFIRRNGAVTISALIAEMGVTATAVRQRVQRLIADGLIERRAERKGRGRPNHCYSLTEKGERKSGNNFADLAVVLWEELRSVDDPHVRRGLLQRVAGRFVERYRGSISGNSLSERMMSLAEVMSERQIPIAVIGDSTLPVLSVLACPYPELAKSDRAVCTTEKLMLSELLGANMRLSECRLDGGGCCAFTPSTS